MTVGVYAQIELPLYIDEQGEFYGERAYIGRTPEEMWDWIICSKGLSTMEKMNAHYIFRRLGLEEADKYRETKEWPKQLPIPTGLQVLDGDGLVNWGNIEAGGFVIDEVGKAIKKEYIPQYGEILDGYDTVGTRYLSPVIDGKRYEYIKRLMPYKQDEKFYEQYEVVGDFRDLKQEIVTCKDQLLKQKIEAYITKVYNDDYTKLVTYSGEVAPVPFWGAGGISI